ncbi:UbiA prenyltransferase [Punctularia strigosozonata HHB-11173 SS5]|uniref:UbiA prenyltransferase n=1 Tax=Punctularia strigosozonata (strain HHB-11173) TaxID=741275 RepID=UPI00044185B2|nr:UbiA prenyltransferase [Punctularia strigosozonata HHB-11173 SS5]EIN08020.1 UbiA prenyltransferase [Punctularia strigosozonata HHB-11173 SS5]
MTVIQPWVCACLFETLLRWLTLVWEPFQLELSRLQMYAGSMVAFWPFGTGCIWNDIVDRDFDRQVERTRHRPIADGRISVTGALIFLAVHIFILLGLVYHMNSLARTVGLMSLLFPPVVYPFMKRITYIPQAWLGIAINCGVPIACAQIANSVTPSCLILYAGTWSWTMWYDTIYACQDKRDDVKAGVKSTALLFGEHTKPVLAVFGSILISALLGCGILNASGFAYYTVSVVLAASLLAKELYQVDLDDPKSCWGTFHRNGLTFGAVVFNGILLDYVLSP